MTFKTIENQYGGAQRKGVSIAVVKRKHRFTTRIRIGADILNLMGWAPGHCLGLAYEENPHGNKLRIGLDPLNGYKLQRGAPRDRGKYLQCTRIGDRKEHKRQTVSYKIVDDYLFVDLPDWVKLLDGE